MAGRSGESRYEPVSWPDIPGHSAGLRQDLRRTWALVFLTPAQPAKARQLGFFPLLRLSTGPTGHLARSARTTTPEAKYEGLVSRA
jgi:hypothetical protein